jgi:microcystin degradation protein MlrC
MKTLEAMARQIEKDHPEIVVVNVFAGFSFADTPNTGISFSAFTFGNAESAQKQLRDLSDWAAAHKKLGNVIDPPLESMMPEIVKKADKGDGPIAVVEPADNVGGGAPGDATTILKALLDHNVEHAAVVINDPETVTILQSVSIGETATVSVGGKGSRLTDGPLELDVTVLNKSDGRFDLEDRNSHLASMSGIHINMGPCVTVKHKGVLILLTTRKTPPFDLGQFRSQGIEPEHCSVIGIKAAVAHRRAYDTITHASYTVSTPGPCTSDLKSFPWQHIRRPIFPLDD